MRHVPRRRKIEEALKRVMENMIREEVTMVNMLCTKKVMRETIDDLDEECTQKVQRRLQKKVAGSKAQRDVAEAYSPPIMTAMARTLGYKDGFALYFTTVDDEGNPGTVRSGTFRSRRSNSWRRRRRGCW